MIGLRRAGWIAAAFAMLAAAIACSSDGSPGTGPAQDAVPTTTPTIVSKAVATATPTASPVPSTPTPSPTAQGTVKVPPVRPPKFVDNADCRDLANGQLSIGAVTLSDESDTVTVGVEIASTPGERSQGLMCRETLPPGTGMLFTWDEDLQSAFWMFNTYVPLDILYIDSTGSVVAIRQMSPCPRDANEDDATWRSRCAGESGTYQPGAVYRSALELPQGWLESQGFDTANASGIAVSFNSGT